MESPPSLSTAPPAATTTTAAQPPQPPHLNSLDSSPRSRQTNSWNDPPPTSPQPPKLRLMCSYGGHIVPRPHDKSLCYIGGTTRIIVIDRHDSFADIHHRLSKSLANNEPFTLRYQLPNEDLDSLISVTTDEDFENMVEEYDRLNYASGSKPGRLRLFLFPNSSSIEQLLVETSSTKSEDWFLDALNGKASNNSSGVSDRGFSESSSVNCLLGLDDDFVGKTAVGGKDVEAQIEASNNGGNGNSLNHDVHSVPDSPMLDTTSSFGSTSSSPSTANLPPVRVHVQENQKVGGLGIEEQFQQINFGVGGNVNLPQKQEEVGSFVATGVTDSTVVSGVPVVVGGEYANRVVSDDERSDRGGNRKPEQAQEQQVHVQFQQQQFPQFQQKQAGPIEMRSADSVSSDGSVANPFFRQGQIIYKEPIVQIQSGNSRLSAEPVDLKTEDQNNRRVQMHPQVQESYYVLPGQFDQNNPQFHQPQQFVHSNIHYLPAGPVPMGSYYPVYSSQQQYHPHHSALEQQYPVYFMPARPAQTYNLPMQQPSYGEFAPPAPSSHPQKSPPAAMPTSAAYSQTRNALVSTPDTATGVYRTAAAASSPLVEVPSSQHQAQHVGYTQIHHPPQSTAPPSAANSNYAYAYTDPRHAEIYSQPLPPQLAAQYQTMSSVPTMVLPDASQQHPENIKNLKTSQP
ncbi:Octicosapeptide/Phox/Bem1p family protein [Abeliophyllum distichum]|uniref:Octicosapeptide/Phox/Bem1p family protein n=1 Tax=Abeliophyllum distichum TaxID=126358 RepID=A0ABD1U203_9LAMI